MKRFQVRETPLAGLLDLERRRLSDSRGFLSRLFCGAEFEALGWQHPVAQINHSFTLRKGTIRGMHFQFPPHGEMKLVSCLRGEVWDVAVDIRADSPTFLRWYGAVLSAENCRALLIPEGFAHGFQALQPESELLYCHSAPYVAGSEGGLDPLDPQLAITWPLPVTELSDRDRSQPFIHSDFTGVRP